MAYLKRSIITCFMAVSAAFIGAGNAAPSINLETQIPGGDVFSAPTHIVARIYESASSTRAIAEQVFLEGGMAK